MTPDQLVDELGAIVIGAGVGALLGILAGVALFTIEHRHEGRSQWPR